MASLCGSVKKHVTFELDHAAEPGNGTQRSTRSVDSASGVRSISDIFPSVAAAAAEMSSFPESSASALSALPKVSLEASAKAAALHRRLDSGSVELSVSVSRVSPEEEAKLSSGVFTIPAKYLSDWSSPPMKRGSFKKSIMKSISVDMDSVNQLNTRLEREAKAVDFAKKGDSVLFFTASKKPVKSSIKVSADGSCLEIATKKFLRTKRQKIELADVHGVGFGPRSKAFATFDRKNDKSWRCFSIVGHSGKTWDFQADNDDSALLWFFALQSLIPLSNSYVSWSRLLWMKVVYKTVNASEFSGIALSNYLMHMVLDAKFSVKRARRISSLVATPIFK